MRKRVARYGIGPAAGALLIALFFGCALVGPALAPYPPEEQHLDHLLEPPSRAHWLGTDENGCDLLSEMLFGARIAATISGSVVLICLVAGIAIGTLAGYFGGAVDEVIMRVTDLMLAFPTVILAMIISAALGAGIRNAVIAIMVAWWPSYARFARGLVLAARGREYVEAARAVGASTFRVFSRHILVNIVSPIVILGTLDVGHAILTFASLSFLGLGPPPQIPEWGSMIASGRDYLVQWWISTFPGLAILTLVLALNVVGDSLRDALDPRLRRL